MDIEHLAGTRLGNYEIESLLGRGGMGVVYKALQISLNRPVALKILPPTLSSDSSFVKRFHREAEAIARLHHANIVQIHDILEDQNLHFFSMEYMEGQTLDEILKEKGRLDIDEAIRIIIQAAQGIAHAHKNGIIHRDIKPSNIILDESGNAKVMDFGLAKLAGRTRFTGTGTIMGTVDHMSPEQAQGEPVDHRTDIWSLGIVLYETLTGETPFTAETDPAIIHKIIYEEPIEARSLNPDVPPGLSIVLARMMAKKMEERYANITEFIKDLDDFPTPERNTRPIQAIALEKQAISFIGDRTPFVGRLSEWSELQQFLLQTAQGRGSLVMIGGEPGVGKTRITEELQAEANRHGFLTLTGHCYEMEGAPSYIPFIEILQSIMRTVEPDALLDTLGAAAPEAAKLVPELRRQFPNIPEPRKLPPEQERLSLFNSLCDFFERLANQSPLLLIVEDLHWTDEPTLLLFQHLAQRLGEMPVLMVGTYRDTELDVARSLAKALEELLRQRLAHDLLLKRFAREDVTAMLQGRSGQEPPSRLVNLIFDETEGNPFFIEEVFHHLVEEEKLFDSEGQWRHDVRIEEWEVPRGVLLVIGRRLERVSEQCRRILARAAVIGRGIGFNVLNDVIELDEDTLFDAIEEAERARLIRSKKSNGEVLLTFVHELIRQTLLNDLSLARRQRLHQRVAEAIEQLYPEALVQHAADLAHHFYQAGVDPEKTVSYAAMAAERATAQTAYEEAVSQYERALQVFERQQPVNDLRHCDLLLALGNAYTNTGNLQRAEEIYFQTIDIARRVSAPNHFAEALITVQNQRSVVGVPDAQILALIEEGLALLPEEDSALRAILLARLHPELMYIQGTLERRLALGEEALAMARRVGDALAIYYALSTRSFFWHLPATRKIADLTEALELAKKGVGKPEFLGWSLVFLLHNHIQIGDIASADKNLAELKEHNEELSLPINVFHATNIEAMRAFLGGKFDETERLAFEALSHGQKANQANAMQYFGVLMFILRWYQGRMAEMEDVFVTEAEKYPDVPGFQSMLAIIHMEMGREQPAREIFERLAANEFADFPQDLATDALLMNLSELAVVFSDPHRAATLYEVLLPHADRMLMVGLNCTCMGAMPLWLGMLAGTMKRWDDSVEHFDHAIETNARIGARPFLARSQHEYARMLIQRGDPGDKEKVRSLLSEATATYRELGMPTFLNDAEELEDNL